MVAAHGTPARSRCSGGNPRVRDARRSLLRGAHAGELDRHRRSRLRHDAQPRRRAPPRLRDGAERPGGDGRLGPRDMLVDQIPPGNPIPPAGTFVNDAGDVVSGASVKADGKSATTNSSVVATIKLPKSVRGHVGVTVTDKGYRTLSL